MASLHDQVVVITGASSGIGYATALAFARLGCSLVLVARREGALEEVATRCADLGAPTLVAPCDVADEPSLIDVVQQTVEQFGRIDIWINNASVACFGKFADVPGEVFRRVVETNFFGAVHGCRAVVPVLRDQRRGTIINVASAYARAALPYWSAYAAAKYAVRAFTESLHQELREEGISVSAIYPSAIDTPIWENGANFAGRRPKATSPTFDPVDVAAAIVACAASPRLETTVGFPAKGVRLVHDLSPALWTRLGPVWAERNQFFDEPADPTYGNVFEPIEENARLRGGWAKQRPPSRTVRALLGAALLAGPLAALGAAWLLGRREAPPSAWTRARELVGV